MISNIIVKLNRQALDLFRTGERTHVMLPKNPHWKRKLRNPVTGRYYTGLKVIVRSFQKDPSYVLSAKAADIKENEDHFSIALKEIRVLLPPFNHQLINEPRRNSIK